ncbi:MAG: hypothetical protein ACRYFS_07645 [Janthinobacterium lividum]
MNTQRKTLNIVGFGIAALAAALIGTAQPASAAGLAHPMRIGQQTTAVRDYDGDRYDGDHGRDGRREREFRREQEIRLARDQEIRREEWRHDRRQDFRDGRRDWHNDHRDRDRRDDSLQIVIR